MSNYLGVRCPVCNKKFTQTDDIVVCPVCGAPHHRECYSEKNNCAFAADHLSGKEWRSPAPEPSVSDGYQRDGQRTGTAVAATCPVCKSHNPGGVIFCQFCGANMNMPPPDFAGSPYIGFDPNIVVYGGLNPNEKIEDETARDMAIYIGPSSGYYLPRFKRMSESPHMLSFNFSAFLFNFAYFFYRKMYLLGGILFGLFVISIVPDFLYTREAMPLIISQFFGIASDIPVDVQKIDYYRRLMDLARGITFLVGLALSFCANRFYHIKSLQEVKGIRESQPEKHDEIAYCAQLHKKGGINRAIVTVVLAVFLALYFLVAMILSYQYLQMGGTLPQ